MRLFQTVGVASNMGPLSLSRSLSLCSGAGVTW